MPFRHWIAALLALGSSLADAQEPCPPKVRITFFDFAIPLLLNGTGMHFETAVAWNCNKVIGVSLSGARRMPRCDRDSPDCVVPVIAMKPVAPRIGRHCLGQYGLSEPLDQMSP